ncbi:MAG: hypothetical protein IPJ81_18015 [Chitinophagaceae bacterium]|nr:hypothetical protein [Chitinophagaceae bacterium]
MEKFIACMCENDYNQLIVSGEPTPEELTEAWTSLVYEFCDLSDAKEAKYKAILASEIKLEKMKIKLAQCWFNILSVCYFPQVVTALKEIGFEDFDLNPDDVDQYQNDFIHITGELNLLRMQIKIKEAEYASLQEAHVKHQAMDSKSFDVMFFRINNYAKREAVNEQTTVQKYCTALRDYLAYIDSQSKVTK